METRRREDRRSGDTGSLAPEFASRDEPRGEIVIVIAPPAALASDAADLDAWLRQALGRVSVKEAVGEIAAITGRPRREVYQRALALAQVREHAPVNTSREHE